MSEGVELCPRCRNLGQCRFEEKANRIAASVQEESLEEALRVHRTVTRMRKLARERGCPKVNEVNPNYPGKHLL